MIRNYHKSTSHYQSFPLSYQMQISSSSASTLEKFFWYIWNYVGLKCKLSNEFTFEENIISVTKIWRNKNGQTIGNFYSFCGVLQPWAAVLVGSIKNNKRPCVPHICSKKFNGTYGTNPAVIIKQMHSYNGKRLMTGKREETAKVTTTKP